MSKHSKQTGFTLIEVMLAMTLLSIMMVLLFASLKISAESWNKGEKKIAEVNEKAVVYQFFKRQLPSIQPVWDEYSENDRQLSFQGQEDKLQFVSVFPASSERKGLQLFEVFFDKADEGTIKVTVRPFLQTADQQEQQEAEEVVLLQQVEAFEISYFTQQDIASEGEWLTAWEEKEQLPALLKISITLQNHSYWPEMVFALKLASGEDAMDSEFRQESG